MASQQQNAPARHAPAVAQYDIIIIGAGICGMYMSYRLRELDLSFHVYEAGEDLGGTWFWNRYPGCRFDSESYSYGYSVFPEVLEEWSWKEQFSPQPETLEYLNFVADKLDLRRDISFDARLRAASFDEDANEWALTFEDGRRARCRFLVAATGPLSAPQMPVIPGIDDFAGEAYHTALWPRDPNGFGSPVKDFTGKRVAVIGTGATGVQVIQEVSKTARQLHVFQRTPNWCAPLKNSPVDAATAAELKASYPEIFARCRQSFGSFIHDFDPRSALEVSAEERNALFEKLYDEPGFGIWLGTFRDVLTDPQANAYASEFVANKIRQRVKDPAVAEKLIPKDHGFGTRRVPLETNYYECYNQDNVELVDCRETPIERITATGIETSAASYEVDMIIYATGFDAVTGALHRIDITGVGGRKLKDKWRDGPRTLLGMQIADFPNLFTPVGPHNGAAFCNIPRCIEQNVDWLAGLFHHLQDAHIERIEAEVPAEDAWTEHVNETAAATLFPTARSWIMGVNENVPDKVTGFVAYAGGFPTYRAKCDEVAEHGYAGFSMR
ncbi:MAG: NAD(P)/FAD-dependent oxidoreductase [Gammaproteobacteria bacterium]